MKAFSERNPVRVAVTGLAVVILLGLAVFYSQSLPIIGAGKTYSADFADAGGLKTGDDVRVAGVKVGTVQSIKLDGQHVRIGFKVKNAWIGDQSSVAIKIKTLLGQEYLQIDPIGTKELKSSDTIPLERTTSPYESVASALTTLGSTTNSINTAQLARSFDALSTTFANTPTSVRAALQGLSALSQTISSRDAELAALVQNTENVTGTVAASNTQFAALIKDGALLLNELNARSAAITSLLNGTRDLAVQLTGLVHDNTSTLGPALAQLGRVTDILVANNSNLSSALSLIGPYYRVLNNAFGSGRWGDIYLCGLFQTQGVPGDANPGWPELNATAQRNCSPRTPGGSG